MSVKAYDAHNGVEKIIRNVTRIAVYNGEMFITDVNDVEFVISSDEIGHHVFYISDNKVRKDHDYFD